MKLDILYQESYSRVELLLRSFFGWLYIGIPHAFLLYIYLIWAGILMIYAWFSILFTRKYPRVAYEAYLGLMRWQLRLNASLLNLVDGYPPFGPNAEWDKVNLEIGYPEEVSRKRLLFVTFLGAIVLIPHFIILYFASLLMFLGIIASWFIVLFTGKYPEQIHSFIVGFFRWSYRINFFLAFLYFNYPEFKLEETETDKKHN